MQTFYIDVYFLINFVVDTVSLSFALRLSRARESFGRILLGGIVGALIAVVTVLVPMTGILYVFFFLCGWLLVCTIASGVPTLRILLRVSIWFLLVETFIGGIVEALYSQLDYWFDNFKNQTNYGAENRTFLFFAAAILIAIGALRLLGLLFSGGKAISNATLCGSFLGRSIRLVCLWDSGNFLTDPMSGAPVVIVKARALSEVLSDHFFMGEYEKLGDPYRERLRFIPVCGISGSRILAGLVAEDLLLIHGREKIKRTVVLAVDKEDGDFGGYLALVPGAVF